MNPRILMSRLSVFLAAVLLAILPCSAERPFRTDDPLPVGLYRWENYGGIDIGSGSWPGAIDHTQVRVSGGIDYGLTRVSEIGAEFDFWVFDDPGGDGIGDLTVHYKHLFWEANFAHPDISLDFRLKMPTASEARGLGSGAMDFGLISLMGWKGEEFHTTLRIGYTFTFGDKDDPRLEFGVGTRYKLADDIRLLGEIYADSNENINQKSRQFVSTGLQYDLNQTTMLDFLLSAGNTTSVPDVGVRFGFTNRM